MENKIKVNRSQKKIEHWNNLIEIFVNSHPVDFSVMNEGTSLHLYPENEHCWSIRLNMDGTWSLE